MQSSSDTPHAPHTVESLLRVVEARESEVAFLKLMVDKLKLQLLRRTRSQFGPSSEQLQDPQIALIEGQPLDEQAVPRRAPKPPAANTTEIDRTLPAHLPREDAALPPRDDRLSSATPPASPVAARPAAGGCARSARTSPSNSSTFPPTSRSSATFAPSSPA